VRPQAGRSGICRFGCTSARGSDDVEGRKREGQDVPPSVSSMSSTEARSSDCWSSRRVVSCETLKRFCRASRRREVRVSGLLREDASSRRASTRTHLDNADRVSERRIAAVGVDEVLEARHLALLALDGGRDVGEARLGLGLDVLEVDDGRGRRVELVRVVPHGALLEDEVGWVLVRGRERARVGVDERLLVAVDVDELERVLRLLDARARALARLVVEDDHAREEGLELADGARLEELEVVVEAREVHLVHALLGDVGRVEVEQVLVLGEEHRLVRRVVRALRLVRVAALLGAGLLLPRRLERVARREVGRPGAVARLVRLVALRHELAVERVVLEGGKGQRTARTKALLRL